MYDIIIIGGGPGGYLAAERAGASGKKILLIEKEQLGGVCLNRGCIPTKSLLNSSKLYKNAKSSAQYGVHAEKVTFNLEEAMAWKNNVIEQMRGGVAYLMKHHKVEVVSGEGKLLADRKVEVNGKVYEGENIIIATGSSTFVPPIPGADSDSVVTSRQMLDLDRLPSSLAVIGGGVIGMEFASLCSNLRIEVNVIEMLDEIIPLMDKDLAKVMRREMKGINFHLGCKVEKIDGNSIFYSKKGKTESLDADMILMAAGRRPNIAGFETSGLDIELRRIKVNDKMQTNLPGVYAVGDVNGESLLAHSAYRMGEVAVNTICGKEDSMRYNAVPWVVYTSPEAAGCGMTEQDAERAGRKVKTASMQMRNNGRFYVENGKANGLCKVIADSDTNVILGVHLLGSISSEMIACAAVMIESELKTSEIKKIIFPHPSVSEVIKDTIWNFK